MTRIDVFAGHAQKDFYTAKPGYVGGEPLYGRGREAKVAKV